MADLSKTVRDLKTERDRLHARLKAVNNAISILDGLNGSSLSSGRTSRHRMSAAGRRKIAAAQKARWSKWKAKHRKLKFA